MCHESCLSFIEDHLTPKEINGKRVIEVGARDVNGSVRSIVESWKPAEYVGVDIQEGPGVDVLCSADHLTDQFDKGSFDVIISTELLEHVRDWRKTVSNIKNICKSEGLILLTTRSHGFRYHGYPSDFWRYELEDIIHIFSDCEILILEQDPQAPGVFVKLKKPAVFIENDLADYSLYSILFNRQIKEPPRKKARSLYHFCQIVKDRIITLLYKITHRSFKR